MTGSLSAHTMSAVVRGVFYTAVEVTLLTPVILVAHAYWLTARPVLVIDLLLVGFGVAGAALRGAGIRRQLWHVALSATAAAVIAWLVAPTVPAVWLLAVACLAAWLGGTRHAAGAAVSPALYVVGIALFAAAGAVFPHVGVLAPTVAALYAAGAASIAFFLLQINERKLAAAIDRKDGGKGGLALDMIVRNRLYVFGLWLAIIGAASVKQLADWARNAFFAVVGFLRWIAALLTPRHSPTKQMRLRPQGRPHLPVVHAGHPPLWMTIARDVAVIIILAILAVLCAYGLYRASRKLAWLLRLLAHRLMLLFETPAAMQSRAYIDEKEHIGRVKSTAGGPKHRDRRPSRELEWSDLLDNRSRIRWLYRTVVRNSVKGGYTFQSHLTPAQVGDELAEQEFVDRDAAADLVALYEDVRYGEQEVPDEPVELLRARLAKGLETHR